MKQAILTIFTLVFLLTANAQSTIYTNDMDYVLGDVKQAFIQNKITTEAQANKLIEGFKNLKVNGIRIPIFAEGQDPNPTMAKYFYNQAVAEGFLIFANPAQSSGGQRIACGILNGALSSVFNDTAKTNVLINRIKDFSTEYKCTWINPFNEDGKPGAAWSAAQMNTIYASLANNLNGAELIGPGVWGIPASIAVLQQTNIKNYISVATTHNLGFNHGSWNNFIALSDQSYLPVWDSEVNHYDKFGTGTRLEAALEVKVDGLVMYNIWNTISLSDGSINAAGQTMKDLYLKKDPVTGIENITQSQSSPELIFPTLISSSTSQFKALNSIEHNNAYTLKVYSPSGQLLFTSTDVEEAWNPSGQLAGVYIFLVSYLNHENRNRTQSGKVIIY